MKDNLLKNFYELVSKNFDKDRGSLSPLKYSFKIV